MTDALLPRLALLAAAAVWQAARSRHYFHMLQLNSYRNERYAAWLSKNAVSYTHLDVYKRQV